MSSRIRAKQNQRVLSTEDIELIEELARIEARENFWAYRQHMRPTMLKGWWQAVIAHELQRFYEDMVAGKRPSLVLMAPPQHGKSWQVTDFISYVAGKNPDIKTIYASFSDDLGIKANYHLQRLYDNPRYNEVFPDTMISESAVVTGQGRALRNSSLLEYVGREGSFRNTTVMGQITGQGLDLGVIDDPLKGRKAANSKTIRDDTWSWLTDDFFTRFSDLAGFILMLTRWHIDDPAGRWVERFPNARVCSFPAIAVKDERFRKKGEPLFPEHKPLEFLLQRKKVMLASSWESLYQQSPIIAGGGTFPIEKLKIIPRIGRGEVKKSVRYWDKAGTEGGGAFTAGVLMHEMKDGRFVVSDLRHGQWNALTREERMKQTAAADAAAWGIVEIWVEQEPGSGGKESAERSITNLRGYIVKADRVTGSKEERAEPYAAQVQAGNVALCAGEWNQTFIDEHETFPQGRYKDIVDGAGGAFNKLTLGQGSYDATLSWVTNRGR